MSDIAAPAEPGTPPARPGASDTQGTSTAATAPALTRASRIRSAAPGNAARVGLKKTQSLLSVGTRANAGRAAKTAAAAAVAALEADEATDASDRQHPSLLPPARIFSSLLPALDLAAATPSTPATAARNQRSPTKAKLTVDKAEYDALKKDFLKLKIAYDSAMLMMAELKDAVSKTIEDVQEIKEDRKRLEDAQIQANASYASVVKQGLDIAKMKEENSRHKRAMQEITAAQAASTKAILEGKNLPEFVQPPDCINWLVDSTRSSRIRDSYCERRTTRAGKTQYILHFRSVADLREAFRAFNHTKIPGCSFQYRTLQQQEHHKRRITESRAHSSANA